MKRRGYSGSHGVLKSSDLVHEGLGFRACLEDRARRHVSALKPLFIASRTSLLTWSFGALYAPPCICHW